ncbi:MAG TPA: PAS domain S-box protein [Thermoanaerobaculia bacterium]|nr:PAS domain S-box protein [Thermoanaerobaculia bacterium]
MTVDDRVPAEAREIEDLRMRLEEAEETLRAIRIGEADGVVVSGPQGDQVFLLRGSEHPYRLFVEEMIEGAVTITAAGLILLCNRRFADLLNTSVDAIIGQNIDSIPNPEVRTCLATLLASTGKRSDPEEISYSADGAVRSLKFVGVRLVDDASVAILVTDVSEAHAREAALRRSNEEMEDRIRERTAALASKVGELGAARLAALNMMEDAVGSARALERANRDLKLQISARRESEKAHRRLATVVEQAAESIIITNTSGVIEYVNPAFERITGYTHEESLGQTPRILKSGKQDAAFYETLWSAITAGSVWNGHFVNKRKDGSLYEEDATISPVRDNDGTITNFVAIKRDVTTEVALGEQLRHAQKIEAIGTLAGGVAHDFNNLLQAMLTMVELLKRKSAEPGNLEHLKQLEMTIRRGSSLTRQLLLFARRETSRRENLDLNQILGDLFAFLRRVVRENIRLFIEPATVPLWISADRGQIEQVIMNLAGNAVDAMPEGGALSIAAGRGENAAWLKVSDTGTGIPETIRDRVFEPFFTTKAAGKGTGLGLSVVHGIIAAHGGRIDVECPAEGGTTFQFELPLQSVVAAVTAATPPEGDLPNGRGERVLLVEDEQAVREGLSAILELLGYAVVAVGTGEEAIEIDALAPFSVLLTDFMLSGMPGIEVVRRLRERWPDMKAILVTGYAAPGVIDAAVAANEFEFLQKPFDMAVLAQTLRAVLDPPGARR